MISFEFSVIDTHPSLEGHFPGNPVVPGVVILDEVMRGVISQIADSKIVEIPTVKFLKILKPNQIVKVSLIEKKSDTFQFDCVVNNARIVTGKIKLKPIGDS